LKSNLSDIFASLPSGLNVTKITEKNISLIEYENINNLSHGLSFEVSGLGSKNIIKID
jgi:hypothetical protein